MTAVEANKEVHIGRVGKNSQTHSEFISFQDNLDGLTSSNFNYFVKHLL